jgi:hypothetical protein
MKKPRASILEDEGNLGSVKPSGDPQAFANWFLLDNTEKVQRLEDSGGQKK